MPPKTPKRTHPAPPVKLDPKPLPSWFSAGTASPKIEKWTQVSNELMYHLTEQLEAGDVALPVFQRATAWTRDQQIELFETMVRGLPVGTLLFWEAPKGTPYVELPGCMNAGSKFHNGRPLLLLDGQQRALAMLAAKRGELGVRWNGSRWGDTGYLDVSMCFDHLDFDHSVSLRELAGDDVWYSAIRAHDTVQRAEIQIVKITGTEAEAREVYRRMNSTGTGHTAADLARASSNPE